MSFQSWTTIRAIHDERVAEGMKKAKRSGKKFADSKWGLRSGLRK